LTIIDIFIGDAGHAFQIGTEADIICDQKACGTRMLGITRLLNKRACTAIGHEDEGTGPFLLSVGFRIDGSRGVAGAFVDVSGITEVGICVIDILSNASAIRRVAEECLTVIVSVGFE